jgi:predicted PurR-regulated permease PerM
MTRAPARWARLAVTAAATLFVLERCGTWLVPLLLAVIFTFVLAPPVRALKRLGLPEPLGAALVIGAIAGALAGALAVSARPAAAMWAEAPAMEERLLRLERELVQCVPAAARPCSAADAAAQPDDAFVQAVRARRDQWRQALPGALASFSISAAATVFLLYFMLLSEQWFVARSVRACATPRARAMLLSGLRQAQREIRAFLLTMGAMSLLLGAATGLALAAIGFPNAAVWGVLTAVLTYVPYIGPALVTLALVLAASAVYGAGWQLLAPAAIFLGLHFVEANLVSPFFMGASLRMRPVFVLVAVLVCSTLWGIVGGFVAVPLLLGLRAAGLRGRHSRLTRLYLRDAS